MPSINTSGLQWKITTEFRNTKWDILVFIFPLQVAGSFRLDNFFTNKTSGITVHFYCHAGRWDSKGGRAEAHRGDRTGNGSPLSSAGRLLGLFWQSQRHWSVWNYNSRKLFILVYHHGLEKDGL